MFFPPILLENLRKRNLEGSFYYPLSFSWDWWTKLDELSSYTGFKLPLEDAVVSTRWPLQMLWVFRQICASNVLLSIMQSLERTSTCKKHNWMLLWKKKIPWKTYSFMKNMNWWSGKIWDWEWKRETEAERWRVNREKRWPPIKKELKFLLHSWTELSMLFQHIILDSLMSTVLRQQERQQKVSICSFDDNL